MIGTIEKKIIDKFTAAQGPEKLGYTAKVETYAGELSEGLDRAVKNFPAFLIVFNGADKNIAKSAKRKKTWTMRWMVICAATSLRNEKEARHGGGTGVGSYQMCMDAAALLENENFGFDNMDGIEVLNIRPLVNDKAGAQLASIYTLDIQTSICISQEIDIAGLDDFKTFHVNWDVPPHGNVTPPPPNDEAADATDTITLPTQGDTE